MVGVENSCDFGIIRANGIWRSCQQGKLAVLVPAVRLRHASDAPVRPELLVTLRPANGLPMHVALRA